MTSSAPADGDLERGLFVYGVVPAGLELPESLTGLDHSAVKAVACGSVAAAVGEIALDRPPGRRADLQAYTAVLDALTEVGPVAPVQFGSVLPDEVAVAEEFLAPSEQELADILEMLSDRVQLNLRATYREDVVLAEVVASDPEIRRLRDATRDLPEDAARADRIRLGELVARSLEARAADDAAFIMDAVLPHVVDHSVRRSAAPPQVLDVALLVDRERQDGLEALLEDLAEGVHERITMRLLGPLPAHDFAGGL